MAYRQAALIERGVGSAGRMASMLADGPMTDYETLRAVDAALASTTAVELDRVVIYDASVNGGELPAACENGGSVAGTCNVYTASQVTTQSPVGFPRGSLQDPVCVGGSWDEAWCPMTRDRERPNPDRVGVHIEARYQSITHMLPGSEVDISHSASYLLEPPRIGD